MYPVEVIAKKICELSGWTVTNLELQKILYIISMLYLGKNDKPLIKEHFESWMYGPVVPELYDITRLFGADEIEEWIFKGIEELTDKQINEFIEKYYNQLKDFKPYELIGLTHKEEGAWAKNYQSGKNKIIPTEDIKQEYEELYADIE